MASIVEKSSICSIKSESKPTMAKIQNSWMTGTKVARPIVKIVISVKRVLDICQPSLLRAPWWSSGMLLADSAAAATLIPGFQWIQFEHELKEIVFSFRSFLKGYLSERHTSPVSRGKTPVDLLPLVVRL